MSTNWIKVDRKKVKDLAVYNTTRPAKGRVLLDGDRLAYEIPGMAGEFAFATWSGLPFGDVPREGGIDNGDFRFGHWHIDVKTTTYYGALLVKKKFINHPIDIYVLAQYDDKTSRVQFHGWHWRDFIRKQQEVNYKLGPSYRIEVKQLRPMQVLLEEIKAYNGEFYGRKT